MRYLTRLVLASLLFSGLTLPALRSEPADVPPPIIDPSIITDPATSGNPEQRDRKAWEDFRKDLGDLPKTDPKTAAVKYTPFLTDHPALGSAVGVDASAELGRLYSNALQDPEQAMKIYDWALGKYRDFPGAVSLITARANLLTIEKKPEEAEKLYADTLPQILHAYPQFANDPMDQYTRMLQGEGKSEEIVKLWGSS